MNVTTWKPILEPSEASAAREALDSIVADQKLAAASHDPFVALWFAYLARESQSPELASRAFDVLDEGAERLARGRQHPALYGGISGVAWLTAHLERTMGSFFEEDESEEEIDACEDIDPVLLARLRRGEANGVYDLITGLVGMGVYGLERFAATGRADIAELVIERLAGASEEASAGLTWRTPPQLLPPWQRHEAPNGYYNLGLAHGVPGIIAFLGHACAAGISVPVARPLLDGAVAWTLSQQLEEGHGARYPGWVTIGKKPSPARMAWCYGGLGVAAALLVAARCVGHEAWRHEALALAKLEAARTREEAHVADAGLCHGAAGNAHLFNRMYQATGESWLRDAARHWIARALTYRRSGVGVGGFQAWSSPDPSAPFAMTWVDDPDFLTGTAGIGLALLAATGTVEPAWDRILLVDAPPSA